jgi:hypothetical protein
MGAHAPSRVVAGAFAGHIFESYTFSKESGDAIGEGACAPRSLAVQSLREDQEKPVEWNTRAKHAEKKRESSYSLRPPRLCANIIAIQNL